jgi:hypothetical protein
MPRTVLTLILLMLAPALACAEEQIDATLYK